MKPHVKGIVDVLLSCDWAPTKSDARIQITSLRYHWASLALWNVSFFCDDLFRFPPSFVLEQPELSYSLVKSIAWAHYVSDHCSVIKQIRLISPSRSVSSHVFSNLVFLCRLTMSPPSPPLLVLIFRLCRCVVLRCTPYFMTHTFICHSSLRVAIYFVCRFLPSAMYKFL